MPSLARTPDGYISTYNIRKGMTLLSKGEWIVAKSDSTELPCYQYTFEDNTYTYSLHDNIIPQSCNIPINITKTDNATFTIGYCIQNNVTFPYRVSDKKVLKGFFKILHHIPTIINENTYEIPQCDLSHGYTNDDISNIINGILYRNSNIKQHHFKRLFLCDTPTDKSMFYLRLGSVTVSDKEVLPYTFPNLFKILYSFNPTDDMMFECMKQPTLYYTEYKDIVNVNRSTFYGLQSQDIDINNFSTI